MNAREALKVIERATREVAIDYRGGQRHGLPLRRGELARLPDGRVATFRGRIGALGALVLLEGAKRVVPLAKLRRI